MQQGDALVGVTAMHERGAQCVQCLQLQRPVVVALGVREHRPSQRDRGAIVQRLAAHVSFADVDPRALGRVGVRRQQRARRLQGVVGEILAAGQQLHLGQIGKGADGFSFTAERAPRPRRLLLGHDRRLEHAARAQFVGIRIEQVRTRCLAFRVRERAPPVLSSLHVGAPRSGLARGQRRPPSHRFGVAGSFGVQRQPRVRVRQGLRQQRAVRHPVQAHRARGRHRAQHRLARQFVPEGDGTAVDTQHARRQAFFDGCTLGRGQRFQHHRFDARAGDRGSVEHGPRGGAQAAGARQDRILHRRRHPRRRCRQHLGDEEGVAAGARMHFEGVDLDPCAQGAHC
jgi:hypothetical protein